jgi:hypothetical protein
LLLPPIEMVCVQGGVPHWATSPVKKGPSLLPASIPGFAAANITAKLADDEWTLPVTF